MREPSGPFTRLLSSTVALMLFVTGGHREVLRAISSSFETLPAGSSEFDATWTENLVEVGSELFVGGTRIALPLILAVFATQVSFGLLTRVAPQLNLWSLGFLASIGVGLICLAVFAPTFVTEIRDLIERAVLNLLTVQAS